MVGTVQDITERKKMELALKEREKRLRLALDSAKMGIFDWDIASNRTTWSRWHEKIWG
jgi:PAS domain-containing protein